LFADERTRRSLLEDLARWARVLEDWSGYTTPDDADYGW
jgi:hypothetical protein